MTLSDGLGVHSLDHIALVVPDLAKACDFYAAFGLEVRAERKFMGIHTVGSAQRWGMLIEGRTKRLHHLSFGVFDADFRRFKQHLEKQGVRLLAPPPGIDGDGLWFYDPDGTLIELKAAQKTSPQR